jgi:hypothetical protein
VRPSRFVAVPIGTLGRRILALKSCGTPVAIFSGRATQVAEEDEMKLITFCALAMALLIPRNSRAEDSKEALHDALDVQASPPVTPPTLPDKASARAQSVQQDIAHGKQGEKQRAAHAHKGAGWTGSHASDAAEAARSEAETRSAQGAAASAAKSANADSHEAAGQARATQARGGKVPGSGGPPGHGHAH